jgi:hypothetical protein
MGEPDYVSMGLKTTEVQVYWFTGHGSIGYKSLSESEREVCVTFVNGVAYSVILTHIEPPKTQKVK